jgi:DNA-binding CsgD family transcriptional regulator
VDYFVVYRLNRLFRDFYQQLGFIRDFIAGSSCKLHALADGLDLETIQDELQLNLMGALAEFERKQTSQNLIHALAGRRRDGYPTGQIPYGWRRTPGGKGVRAGIAPCPEELQWVRRCFDLALTGQGIRQIARELTRLAAPPPGNTGRWEELKVHRLLGQPFHAGLIWDQGQVKQGVHWEQRVIEPEEWERVQASLASRKRERIPYDGKGRLPLYHVGHCGSCGARLQVVEVDGEVAYRCPGSAYQGQVLSPAEQDALGLGVGEGAAAPAPERGEAEPDGEAALPLALDGVTGGWCPGWQKRAAPVDAVLVRLLRAAVRLPEFQALAGEEARALVVQEGQASLAQRRGQLQRALTESQQQVRRLVDLHLENRLPRELYDEKYERLAANQRELETELADVGRRLEDQESDAALLGRIHTLLADFPRLWEAFTPDERRQFVADLTEYVVLERTAYRHARLRVKIHFLPEQNALLSAASSRTGGPGPRGAGPGVAGLTPRELAFLYWAGQGRTVREIAAHWQASQERVYALQRRVLERLQVPSLAAAVELAAARVTAEQAELPLDESTRSGCPVWGHRQAERIRQVLTGHQQGLSRPAIAETVGLAPQSVRHYEWKACKQYGVATLAEALVCFAAAAPVAAPGEREEQQEPPVLPAPRPSHPRRTERTKTVR